MSSLTSAGTTTMSSTTGVVVDRERRAALARWAFLRRLVFHNYISPETDLSEISVRRHAGFKLYPVEQLGEKDAAEVEHACLTKDHKIVRYSVSRGAEERVDMLFRVRATEVNLADIDIAQSSKVDNTGNVCIWPSEEVLLYYCVAKVAPEQWLGKHVCELGAGATALAGLSLASLACLASMVVTDGNPQAAEGLAVNVLLNASHYRRGSQNGAPAVSGHELKWDRSAELSGLQSRIELAGSFDVVMLADCLFFKDYHEDLLHILDLLLAPGGRVIHLGPRRGNSTEIFLEKARACGDTWEEIRLDERYDDAMWEKHEAFLANDELYDPGIHYPLLLNMVKKSKTS